MTLPEENLTTGASSICEDCGIKVELQVCRSAAGYYIGTWCGCGPYSRESDYYNKKETAEKELEDLLSLKGMN